MPMSSPNEKIVEFNMWCPKCKHSEKSESEDPCFTCLENPVNLGSRKPIKYEEGDHHEE